MFADFLTPMLEFDPDIRATAEQCLKHPWLSMQTSMSLSMASPPNTKPLDLHIRRQQHMSEGIPLSSSAPAELQTSILQDMCGTIDTVHALEQNGGAPRVTRMVIDDDDDDEEDDIEADDESSASPLHSGSITPEDSPQAAFVFQPD